MIFKCIFNNNKHTIKISNKIHILFYKFHKNNKLYILFLIIIIGMMKNNTYIYMYVLFLYIYIIKNIKVYKNIATLQIASTL
jgi:hypothetical protein